MWPGRQMAGMTSNWRTRQRMKRVFFYYYWWPLILVFEIRCHFLFLLKLNQHVPQERSLSHRHFSPPGVAGRPFLFFFFSPSFSIASIDCRPFGALIASRKINWLLHENVQLAGMQNQKTREGATPVAGGTAAWRPTWFDSENRRHSQVHWIRQMDRVIMITS